MLTLNLSQKSSSFNLLKILKKGEIVVLPTDTIYGFSCVISNKKSINKIYEIKKHPKEKTFLVLCSDLKMLKKYFVVDGFQKEVLDVYINDTKAKPTSFILKPKSVVINFLNLSTDCSVAVRLPKNIFLSRIIKELNEPLISTSCNLSGETSLNNLKKIFSFFSKQKLQPDYLINLKGFLPKRKASRIIDIRESEKIKIIRN